MHNDSGNRRSRSRDELGNGSLAACTDDTESNQFTNKQMLSLYSFVTKGRHEV